MRKNAHVIELILFMFMFEIIRICLLSGDDAIYSIYVCIYIYIYVGVVSVTNTINHLNKKTLTIHR